MPLKDADEMENSADPDQSAHTVWCEFTMFAQPWMQNTNDHDGSSGSTLDQ